MQHHGDDVRVSSIDHMTLENLLDETLSRDAASTRQGDRMEWTVFPDMINSYFRQADYLEFSHGEKSFIADGGRRG